MKIIYNKVFLEHDTGMHPENKSRLECLGKIPEVSVENGEKYLELVHNKEHIAAVKEACEKGVSLDPDTLASKGSYEAAIRAVGAVVMASQSGDFAAVRPPGHHAYPDHSSGFCLFNNIAIAARRLVEGGKRVMIFDFDGHLGNGTMDVFYDTDKVLFWSLHQYPAFDGHLGNGTMDVFYDTDKVLFWSLHQYPAYPGMGDADEIGEGKGKGYTVNVPLPMGSGDDVYMDAVNRLMPIASQFKPDVVGVSAGFDAYQHDPLLQLRLSMNAYYKLGKRLGAFKNVFATLEGGYNTEFLDKCIFNFIDGVNGEKQRFKEEETSTDLKHEFNERMKKVEENLGEYWRI
jgi:acetoin utilization deacetylase AcuC-like enzyme